MRSRSQLVPASPSLAAAAEDLMAGDGEDAELPQPLQLPPTAAQADADRRSVEMQPRRVSSSSQPSEYPLAVPPPSQQPLQPPSSQQLVPPPSQQPPLSTPEAAPAGPRYGAPQPGSGIDVCGPTGCMGCLAALCGSFDMPAPPLGLHYGRSTVPHAKKPLFPRPVPTSEKGKGIMVVSGVSNRPLFFLVV